MEYFNLPGQYYRHVQIQYYTLQHNLSYIASHLLWYKLPPVPGGTSAHIQSCIVYHTWSHKPKHLD